jgi:2-polyprenyl-3-methyl-5-hydroxy-6-metoxy-1,4-benzoquinol methylase
VYSLLPGLYDYSVCHEVIEHLNKPEKAITKIVDSARKACVISTPNGSRVRKGKYDHQLFNFVDIKNLFKSYNTKIDIFYDTFFIKIIK